MVAAEPFATVLWVGHGLTPEIHDALRARGLGLLVAETPARAFRLLHAFQVGVVICAVPQFHTARALAELNPPVILLGRTADRWSEGGVLLLNRDRPADTFASAVRDAITTYGHPPDAEHHDPARRTRAPGPAATWSLDDAQAGA